MEANCSYQGCMYTCLVELQLNSLIHMEIWKELGLLDLNKRKPWTVLTTTLTMCLQLLSKCHPTVLQSTQGHD